MSENQQNKSERAVRDREQHAIDYSDTKHWYFDVYVPHILESMRQAGRKQGHIENKQKALLESGKNPDVIEAHIPVFKQWKHNHLSPTSTE